MSEMFTVAELERHERVALVALLRISVLSDRDVWEKWSAAGRPDTRDRARALAGNILKNHEPRGLTPDQEKDILNTIDGIVPNPR